MDWGELLWRAFPVVAALAGAVTGASLSRQTASKAAEREWRLSRLDGFVQRAYRLSPVFRAAIAAADRGDPDEARRLIATVDGPAGLMQEIGYARIARSDIALRVAIHLLLSKKVFMTDALLAELAPNRTFNYQEMLRTVEELEAAVMDLDAAAEDFLFERSRWRRQFPLKRSKS